MGRNEPVRNFEVYFFKQPFNWNKHSCWKFEGLMVSLSLMANDWFTYNWSAFLVLRAFLQVIDKICNFIRWKLHHQGSWFRGCSIRGWNSRKWVVGATSFEMSEEEFFFSSIYYSNLLFCCISLLPKKLFSVLLTLFLQFNEFFKWVYPEFIYIFPPS